MSLLFKAESLSGGAGMDCTARVPAPTDGAGLLPLLAVLNHAAVNTPAQVFGWTAASFLLGDLPEWKC